jgi:hypothetical protein
MRLLLRHLLRRRRLLLRLRRLLRLQLKHHRLGWGPCSVACSQRRSG